MTNVLDSMFTHSAGGHTLSGIPEGPCDLRVGGPPTEVIAIGTVVASAAGDPLTLQCSRIGHTGFREPR